jgi:hypothetical protein
MSIIKGLFLGLKNQKVIPFNQMTPELHNQISSGLAKIMMAAKMTKAKLTKSQRDYIMNQAKQVQEFEDRYITGIKDKAGNIINKGKEKVADLFNLQGKKLDPKKNIMGGTQAETEAEIAERLVKENKKNIVKIKNRKMVKDSVDNASPGFVKGDKKYNAQLVADDLAEKKFGKDFYDLDQRQQMDLYSEALDGLNDLDKFAQGGRAGFKEGTGMFEQLFYSKDRPILSGLNTAALFDLVVAAKDAAGPLLGFADGGRIGYKDGPDKPGRRSFIKAAVGLASLLPFGIGRGVKMAAPAVSKAAELTGPALDKIVETVMSLGKFVSLKGKRVKEMVTKKKHEGVEVTEDVADQSYIIKKGDKEIYYKPGRQDETGGFEDDIIEVIEDRVKKAGGGGIGYMLGE